MNKKSKPIYLLSQYDKENRIFFQIHNNTQTHLLHFHDCYEIAGFMSGKGIHHLNGKDMNIEKNDVFIITPKDYHSFYNLSPKNMFFNVMFSKKLISENTAMNMSVIKRKHLSVSSKTMNQLVALFNIFENIKSNPSTKYSESFYENFIDIFITIIAANCRYTENLSNDNGLSDTAFSETVRYINDHFKENITLKSVAKNIGYSYTYLSKLFHKKTGLEFNKYLNSLKIENAKNLLLTTDDSILCVCNKCGYYSMTSFLRNFKEFTNLSPSEFVKKYKTSK